MLLALDDSDKTQKKRCIGLVALPDQFVPDFEKDFTSIRLKQKLWQELKWTYITEKGDYFERYKPFIDLFFKSQACFYVWCYDFPNDEAIIEHFGGKSSLVFHKYAFGLIKATSRKIRLQTRITNPNLHIVYDRGSDDSENQIKLTKEMLKYKVSLPIANCCEADSKVLSLLQIADILTGCSMAEANNYFSNPAKRKVYDYVVSKIKDGEKLIFTSPVRPVLPFSSFKIDGFIVSHQEPVNEASI